MPSFRKTVVSADSETTQTALSILRSVGKVPDDESYLKIANELQETYFKAVIDIIGDDGRIDFHSCLTRDLGAFAKRGRYSEYILLDEQLEFWLLEMSLFCTIASAKPVPNSDLPLVARCARACTTVFFDPYARDLLEKEKISLFDKYAAYLEESHLLSRAMIVFIICHEISHFRLFHLDSPASVSQEREADSAASAYYVEVMKRGANSFVSIETSQAFAPLLFFDLLIFRDAISEQCTGRRLEYTSHPTPSSRRNAVRRVLEPHLDILSLGRWKRCRRAIKLLKVS